MPNESRQAHGAVRIVSGFAAQHPNQVTAGAWRRLGNAAAGGSERSHAFGHSCRAIGAIAPRATSIPKHPMTVPAYLRSRPIVLLLGALSACAYLHAADAPSIAGALQPFVDRHELAGAVTMVVSKDRVLSLDAVGYSDIANNKKMAPDAVFWIASMSKPIAATALMQLVDEGKVSLDAPVELYLPEFNPKIMEANPDWTGVRLHRPLHAITVRHLLSHTSGIPFSSSLESPTLDLLPLAIRVQSYALEPLMFEPGSAYSYSNAGFNVVAHIVEVVSGMRYEDFLQERLFNPLGMNDTTFWPTEAQLQRLAKSYGSDPSGTGLKEISITQLHSPLSDRAHRYPVPAGGLFSTASDLGRYCQLFLNGGTYKGRRFISESSIHEMTHNQLSAAVLQKVTFSQHGLTSPDGYGLGWLTRRPDDYGHPGAYFTNMRLYPGDGLATVWLVQHSGFPGEGAKSEAGFESAAMAKFWP
jgi:CubicO group peptidase (beta-lactamase class C family)